MSIAVEARPNRGLHVALWVIQALLAALFLFAGGMKLAMPADKLAAMPLPVAFVRFIGVAEVAGALGLVLPAATRVRPILTPLAAVGLTIIMVGGVGVSIMQGMAATAWIPTLCGVLTGLVAWGRVAKARIQPRG
jgi:uncharacterized membrane protein YphA (DoxX/SURF4 family)